MNKRQIIRSLMMSPLYFNLTVSERRRILAGLLRTCRVRAACGRTGPDNTSGSDLPGDESG